MPRDVGVVIVAAGQGRRMGGDLPKQYRELAGVPMLLRALRPFTSHPDVSTVVVALPPADVAEPPGWLGGMVGDALRLVPGGAERSESVANGLAALPRECTVVLVHDAARPLVDSDIVTRVIETARRGEGAIPAVPVGDTLKEAEAATGRTPGPLVQRTLPREGLWRAQTPQGFPRPLLEQAHARARQEGVSATDDAALVERVGGRVRIVPGSELNFKLTTDADFHLAELLLRRSS